MEGKHKRGKDEEESEGKMWRERTNSDANPSARKVQLPSNDDGPGAPLNERARPRRKRHSARSHYFGRSSAPGDVLRPKEASSARLSITLKRDDPRSIVVLLSLSCEGKFSSDSASTKSTLSPSASLPQPLPIVLNLKRLWPK